MIDLENIYSATYGQQGTIYGHSCGLPIAALNDLKNVNTENFLSVIQSKKLDPKQNKQLPDKEKQNFLKTVSKKKHFKNTKKNNLNNNIMISISNMMSDLHGKKFSYPTNSLHIDEKWFYY